VREEWSNAAASMVLNQDYKDQIVSVFKLADRMNLVGDFSGSGRKGRHPWRYCCSPVNVPPKPSNS